MIIDDIKISDTARGALLSGTVRGERSGFGALRLEILLHDQPVRALLLRADAFVACALVPAMALHEELRVVAPISRSLFNNLQRIQEIYRRWMPWLSSVEICAPIETVTTPEPKGSGLFFSGGVDSWYSLLKHRERPDAPAALTHLLLVFGFDVRLNNTVLFDQIAASARAVADASGLELVVAETNIRSISDRVANVPWALYHGGPLAAIGLALGATLRRCVIASTHAYSQLQPWGSHPWLDPLWSTETLEFVHDGCEALRSEKVRRLACSPLALSTLRVCWMNEQTEYNCGSCEKCLRTMIGLYAAGALERCSTFRRKLTSEAVRSLDLSESGEPFFDDLERILGPSAEGRELAAAIRHALRRRRWRAGAGRLARQCFGPAATLANLRAQLSPQPFRRDLVTRTDVGE